MNEHIECFNQAIEKIKSYEGLKTAIENLSIGDSIMLADSGPLKDKIKITRIQFGVWKVPMLVFQDSNPAFDCRMDYPLKSILTRSEAHWKSFMISIINRLKHLSETLLELGYSQHGILIFSKGEVDYHLNGFGHGNCLEHKLTAFHGNSFKSHWVNPMHQGEDFLQAFKLIEKEIGMSNFMGSNSQLRDWVIS